MPERIHKVLANVGLGSRRSIERWVAEGRITVDGRVAKVGEQLQGRERVCFDGKPIRLTAAKLARPTSDFLAYYKPGATRGSNEDRAALEPIAFTLITERRRHAPRGRDGGADGEPGRNLLNGEELPGKASGSLEPGDRIRIETPGGGGYGEPG